MSEIMRLFRRESVALLNKRVKVILKDGKELTGTLVGIHEQTLAILLKNVSDGEHNYPLMLLPEYASVIATTLFDVDKIVRRLEKYFHSDAIEVIPERGIVIVEKRIRISEKGVEGSGPLARRVREILKDIIK